MAHPINLFGFLCLLFSGEENIGFSLQLEYFKLTTDFNLHSTMEFLMEFFQFHVILLDLFYLFIYYIINVNLEII